MAPKQIPRLSQNDDEIYGNFRQDFPDMNVAKLDELNDLKSAEMKTKWRNFCEKFKHVEDYSFATLIRLDSRYLHTIYDCPQRKNTESYLSQLAFANCRFKNFAKQEPEICFHDPFIANLHAILKIYYVVNSNLHAILFIQAGYSNMKGL